MRQFTCPKAVTHPSTNRARCRATALIETDGGNTWRVMIIPTGAYSITALNTEINDQLSSTGDRNKIHIREIEATPRCEMKTAANVSIDFTHPSSINTILGFDCGYYGRSTSEKYTSRNDIDILSVNSIYVNCDLITNSYVNGVVAPVIYSFFPNVAPGYKVVETPQFDISISK